LSTRQDIKGIHIAQSLGPQDHAELWDSIHVSNDLKDSLLCQALLNFSLRSKVSRKVIPLHGIILLVGKPGTGKTSLARGLASKTAGLLPAKKMAYLEVEPHSLSSSAMGKTQKAVTELFGQTIAEYAQAGPTFVLLDEVETIAVDRSKLSLDANPIDIHRATDAALVQLDHLGEQYPNLLLVATSNFPQAIDSAFISRSDLLVTIPLPDKDACRVILADTLRGLSKVFPKVEELSHHRDLTKVAEACHGLDGRQIRKMVASACTFHRETAADPNKLKLDDLLRAADKAVKERRTEGKV
jgi:AAA+ superfamily predicted ATPase